MPNYASTIKSLQKRATTALKNMIEKGIKDLPRLIKNLETLNQTHIEFDLGNWFIVIEKQK